MITQQTAAKIWAAYREIEVSEKLIADMKKERDAPFSDIKRHEATLKDAFGRRQHLELGIPCGDNGHRLYQVEPELAESVIRAHIAHKRVALVEANECARIELSTDNNRICVTGED
jgi:hypothetical protein